jgi:ABC-type polysaccharide/polyol phosphate export permease
LIFSSKESLFFSSDPFAALWPFISIVSAVIVLVIGILIFEKRQKAAKKNAVVEDEVIDNATDP